MNLLAKTIKSDIILFIALLLLQTLEHEELLISCYHGDLSQINIPEVSLVHIVSIHDLLRL